MSFKRFNLTKNPNDTVYYDFEAGDEGENVTLYNREEKDIFKSLTEAAIFVLSKYDIVAERSARKDNSITIIED